MTGIRENCVSTIAISNLSSFDKVYGCVSFLSFCQFNNQQSCRHQNQPAIELFAGCVGLCCLPCFQFRQVPGKVNMELFRLCILLFIASYTSGSETTDNHQMTQQALSFNAERTQKEETVGQNSVTIDPGYSLNTRTIGCCFRLLIRYTVGQVPLSVSKFGFYLEKPHSGYGFIIYGQYPRFFDLIKQPITPNRWVHFCFTVSNNDKSQTMKVFLNGFNCLNKTYYDGQFGEVLIGSPFIVGKNNQASNFYGKLTDFGIWNRTLSDEEMVNFTRNCQPISDLKGKFF